MAKLFDDNAATVYTRTHDAATFPTGNTAEYEIEVGFVNAVTFTSMTIDKDGTAPFPADYKNACLSLFKEDGTQVGTNVCTDNEHGFDGVFPTPDDDNTTGSITFTPASPAADVKTAKLTFDTTDADDGIGGTGNAGQPISLTGLSMVYA